MVARKEVDANAGALDTVAVLELLVGTSPPS